ncbi:MAG: hypothetical protein H6742_12180 [Alphaproteobacteria bacterium]|nr:hypothetical protein [Alphaproteobacteria bacterium]
MRAAASALAVVLSACTVQAAQGPVPAAVAPAASLVLPGPAPTLSAPVDAAARLSVRTHADLPSDAPSVVVHAPAGVDLERLRVVVFLHGWESDATSIAARLAPVAGDDAVLVVPQLAWRARSGNPGAFSRPGVADAWLSALVDEVLVPELGIAGPDAIDEIVLVAHSGGYVTLIELLENGHWPVRSVALLDALYGGADKVAAWTLEAPGRRALSLHTTHPGTTGQSRRLAAAVAAGLGADAVAVEPDGWERALAAHRVVVAETPVAHGAIPQAQLGEVLANL